MYDSYLGGKDHWPADKEAAEQILAVAPEVRAIARANRDSPRSEGRKPHLAAHVAGAWAGSLGSSGGDGKRMRMTQPPPGGVRL
jgi:hypothetical protein